MNFEFIDLVNQLGNRMEHDLLLSNNNVFGTGGPLAGPTRRSLAHLSPIDPYCCTSVFFIFPCMLGLIKCMVIVMCTCMHRCMTLYVCTNKAPLK